MLNLALLGVLFCTTGDPFKTSTLFGAKHIKARMPSDIGGTLNAGSDGHCCLGMALPALIDEAAVWERHITSLVSAEHVASAQK